MTRSAVYALALLPILAGCADDAWFGEAEGPRLPGERISVLDLRDPLRPEPGEASAALNLPEALANDRWSQRGGDAAHAPGHVALGAGLARAWTADIGEGASDSGKLGGVPVVADGRVFVIDAGGVVSAFSLADGAPLWRTPALPEHEPDGFGGGLALGDGRLYAATGSAEALALDPDDGQILWRRELSAPVRGGPAFADGRLHVITLDNRTHTLEGASGELVWVHDSVAEATVLVGGTTPAVAGGVVVSAYSSGEIVALKRENGIVLWSDSLAPGYRSTLVGLLADIPAPPAIADGRIHVIGNAGRAGAIDMRTGERLWDALLGGAQMPWLAGGYLFTVTDQAELVAVNAATGDLRWVTQLRRYEDEEDRTGDVLWFGPVLAGDRLVLANSLGEILFFEPEAGGQVDSIGSGGKTFHLPPVVAAQTLFLLANDGTLTAWR